MDRGRIVVGVLLLTLVFAAMGYVVATGYLTFRDYGLRAEIDFFEIARGYLDWRIVRPDDFQIVNVIVGGCAAVGLVASAALSGQALTRFGSTHFQKAGELRRNGFFGKIGTGFIVGKTTGPRRKGRMLTSRTFPHALVVAPTGRGKTSGFVIPNLLTFKGSAVVLDVKGENFEATARHRAGQGDEVFRFAPTDWHDRRTHRYNPLLRIAQLEDVEQQQMELQLLATLFLQSENDKVKGLLEGGIELFVAAGLLAFQRGVPTLGEIYRIASEGGDKQKAYRSCAAEVNNGAARMIFIRLASTNNDTLTSYLSLLMTSGLNQWSNPAIDRATEVSDFDFRDIRKKPMTVYLVVAPNMVKPLAALIRLFFSDLIASMQSKEPGPDEPWTVMILLDEFNRLGKMPIVVESIETLRSYKGHLAIVTQTIPALDEIYGENTRRALQGNAGVKLYLTPSDEKTVEELSKAVGKTTKRVVTRSRSIGRNPFEGRSMSERTEDVALLTEDDARRMSLDDIIMVVDAQMPIRAKRIQYFKDPFFKRIHKAQTGELPFPEVSLSQKARGAASEPKTEPPVTAEDVPVAVAAGTPPQAKAQGTRSEPLTSPDAPMPGMEPEPAPSSAPDETKVSGLPSKVSVGMAGHMPERKRVQVSARRKSREAKALKTARLDRREVDLSVHQQLDQTLSEDVEQAEAALVDGTAQMAALAEELAGQGGKIDERSAVDPDRPRACVLTPDPEFLARQRAVLEERRKQGMNLIVMGDDGRIMKIAPDGTESELQHDAAGRLKA